MGFTKLIYSPYASAAEREMYLIRPGDRVGVRAADGSTYRYIVVPECGYVRFRVCLFGSDSIAQAGDYDEGLQVSGFTVASVAFPLGRELCEVAEGERYRRCCIPAQLSEECEIYRVERDPNNIFNAAI